jgi:hypothetical protein
MDSSQFKSGAGRYAISRFAIENYPRWIPMAELGSVRDSTSSEKKEFSRSSRDQSLLSLRVKQYDVL